VPLPAFTISWFGGFRNTAIHNYKMLDLAIVEAVLQKHLTDFSRLCQILLAI
jgi:uncharacterized protein YutE (UPF0331/DUF86 family)